MSRLLKALFLAFLVAMLAGCPTKTCGPSNCIGCCDATGACLGGTTDVACGSAGNVCRVCSTGMSCALGQCGLPVGVGGGTSTGGGGGAAVGGGNGTGGGSSSSEQVVLQSAIFHANTGVRTVPTTFDSATLELFVRNGSTFTPVPGAATGPGRYVFSQVPSGTRYLRFGRTWVVDPASPIDFSYHQMGRSDVGFADGGGTIMNFTTTGMAPWQDDDELQLVDLNADLVGSSMKDGLLSWPDAGAVPDSLSFDAFDALTYWYGSAVPLPDTSRGDTVTLTQLRSMVIPTDGGSLSARRLVRSANIPSLVVTPGGSATAVAAFTTPAAMGSLSVSWRRSAFWALASQVATNPRPTSTDSFSLSAVPYSATEGSYSSSPDLFTIPAQASSGDSSDVSFQADFGNPFPPNWVQTVAVDHCFFGPRVPIGTDAGTYSPGGCVGWFDLYTSAGGQPVVPRLGPPTNLRIDGNDAATSSVLTSLTPTITWAPPTLGTPRGYWIDVRRVISSGPTSWTSQRLVSLRTTGTSVVIPPGVLQAGQRFIIRCQAYVGTDVRALPFQSAFPIAWGEAVSTVLRAP